ncbi:MAG TPA: GlsB/YeaQ/YmgE family stress response membrane protein [Patescibacteria group bacterium]|nr:GlsB/YeaQ/YmgE family stress response membrane protein [Patescibacteria group bacterium]
MSIIWALIIGLVAGAIAKLIMPGKDPGGIIVTMLLGVAGSFLGTFLASMIGWGDGGEAGHLIAGIIGAIIILAIYRMVARRNNTPVA